MSKKPDISTMEGRIRAFAKAYYGSMRKLSDASGVNYSQLAEYRDSAPPGGLTVSNLIQAGMNAHWLFTGQGPMAGTHTDGIRIEEGPAELLERALERIIERVFNKLSAEQQEGHHE